MTNNPNGSVEKRMAVGAGWMVLMRLFVRGIGLISTMILARILMPEDFGLIALGMSVVGMLEILGDFGLEWVLIRYPRRERDLYDTAWTIGLIKAVSLALILVLGAETLSTFFGDPRLEAVFWALAVNSLLMDFRNIGVVEFRKELNFKMVFLLQGIQKIFAFVVTLILALAWRDYWALLVGIIAGNLAFMVASFILHPYRPWVSLSRWRELISFSVWLLLNSIAGAFVSRAPTLILGKFIDASNLGYFSVGKEVAELPTTELVWPIASALYPGYTKFAGDPVKLRAVYLGSYEILFMLAAPVGVGLALTAPWFVPLLLGKQWGAAVYVVQVLSIAGIFKMMTAGAGSMYLTLGKPKIPFFVTVFSLAVFIPLLIVLVQRIGMEGALYSLLISYVVTAIMHLFMISRLLQLPWYYGATTIWRSLIALIGMTGIITLIGWSVDPASSNLKLSGELAILVIVGALAYIVVQISVWMAVGQPKAAESKVIDALKSSFGNIRSRANAMRVGRLL